MPRKKPSAIVAVEKIESRIHIVRGQRVMLDEDIAQLYGIPTFALNQAVKRNLGRFPDDFAFALTPHEVTDLISQTVISSSAHGGRRKPPRAFTEQGVAMLSSVLRSPQAVRVNIEIMRTFIRLRRLLATPGELVSQLQQLAETVQLHDSQIKTILDVLQKMLTPPPDDKSKRRIGFLDTNSYPPTEEKK
jgi:hypothetical protein